MAYMAYQAHYYLILKHFGFNDHAVIFVKKKSKYSHFLMILVNIQV